MILLSLASKQVWPQVLVVAHLRPQRLYLLHSEEAAESRIPAQRVKRFFDQCGVVPKGSVKLVCIADRDFATIERQLDELLSREGLPPGDCLVNFTGGNKLMATAAFRWASRRGVSSLYLERRNQLTWFEPREGEIITRQESVDGHMADIYDPLRLLQCQLDASEVLCEGQLLKLSPRGTQVSDEEFWCRLPSLTREQVEAWLTAEGSVRSDAKEGDGLELIVAAALLRLGVRQVRRSLELKVHTDPGISARRPHAEIDLLFNHGGRLWVVDCKDRRPSVNLVEGLQRVSRPLHDKARDEYAKLLERLRDELTISETKALKEDLAAARELGGLLGETLCIRRAQLSEEAREFAKRHRIHLIENCRREGVLRGELDRILYPDRPATADDLRSLEEARAT